MGVIRAIRNFFLQILSLIALVIGILYMVMAITYPQGVNLNNASAVQVTQVYTEGIYCAAIAIMCFLAVILLQVLMQQSNKKEMQTLIENSQQTNQLLKRLGVALTKRT